jgi:ABC-type microcin C transport system permease subunit YejE
MTEQPQPPTDTELLAKIEKHLQSIHNGVSFFVVLAILAIILQVLSALTRF